MYCISICNLAVVHSCVWPAARTVSYSDVRQIPTWTSYLCGEPYFLSDNKAFDSRHPHWNQDTSARWTIIAQWNNRVPSARAQIIANASSSCLPRPFPLIPTSNKEKNEENGAVPLAKGKHFHFGFRKRDPWQERRTHLHLNCVITMKQKTGRRGWSLWGSKHRPKSFTGGSYCMSYLMVNQKKKWQLQEKLSSKLNL